MKNRKNRLVLVSLSILTSASCVSTNSEKIAQDWRVLRKARALNCDLMDFGQKSGSKFSDLTLVKEPGSKDGVFLLKAFERNGSSNITHVPENDYSPSTSVSPLKLNFSSNYFPVGYLANQNAYLFYSQNFEETTFELRDLIRGKVLNRFSLGAGGDAFDISFLENRSSFYLSWAEEENFFVSNIGFRQNQKRKFLKKFSESYKIVSLRKSDDPNLYLYTFKNPYLVFLKISDTGHVTKSSYKFKLGEIESLSVDLDYSDGSPDVRISAIAGDSYVGTSELVAAKFGLTKKKIFYSKRRKLESAYQGRPKIFIHKGKTYLANLSWLESEAALGVYEVSEKGISSPKYFGALAKGAEIESIRSSGDEIAFIVSAGKTRDKNFLTCKLSL